MANWDVIVIGLGGVGSAAAYHLAKRDLEVLAIDQFPPAHDRGSSHGVTRIIRQAYFEDSSYVPLLRRAYQLWDDLEHDTGMHLFHRTGLVEFGPADGVVVPGVLRSASEHGIDVESLPVEEVTRRWPGFSSCENATAVIELNAGYLRVEDCVGAHLQCASAAGVECRHNVVVRRWSSASDSVCVETETGIEHAARLVIAAGPWSTRVLGDIGMPFRVLRKHQYWYVPRSVGYREADGFPCFFYETPTGCYYGFPSIEGVGLKVARHDGGTPIEQPAGEHPEDRDDAREVQDFLTASLPGVGTDLRRQSGCYYTMTPDEHFVVDLHPRHHQVSVVAGLSGHGFKFTSVLGEMAAQLVTDGATSLDTSLLRVLR